MRYGDSVHTEKHSNVNIPLAEFDPDKKAIIEPAEIVRGKSPSAYCVMSFFGNVIRKLLDEGRLEKVQDLLLPSPSVYPNEAYKMEHEGKSVLVVHPGVGAALAAGTFDELIALGCRKFVACGSAGVLKAELARGDVVIPSTAVRDEGTSFHYCPPSREITMDRGVIQKLEAVLKKHKISYSIGKTWTTDGFYRETKGKVANRCAEGCLTVDMECSALLAVAGFRDVAFGQYLAVADDVSGDKWDPRHVEDRSSFDEKLFWLSVEACLDL